MKLIYKLFMFGLIFRLMPVVIAATGVFPNTALNGIGYSFDANDSAITIVSKIVSPLGEKNTGIGIPGTSLHVSIEFTLTSILAALVIVAIVVYRALPVVAAAATALLILPMLINIGYTLVRTAQNEYHSSSLALMMLSLIVAAVALGVITLLEFASGSQDVSDT